MIFESIIYILTFPFNVLFRLFAVIFTILTGV